MSKEAFLVLESNHNSYFSGFLIRRLGYSGYFHIYELILKKLNPREN